MDSLKNKSFILAGLISSKENIDAKLNIIENEIFASGGKVVGIIIQRRGVSRDKRPGGSKRMNRPMNPSTFLGKGKINEIKNFCLNYSVDGVFVLNSLSPRQIKNIEIIVGCPVRIWKNGF